MKLIRCVRGRVWDIAVDVRPTSPTFLKWHSAELTPANSKVFIVPEGFAHGFQVLEPGTELLYLHTAPYVPSAEGGLHFNDPSLGIRWPLTVTEVSERDQGHPWINANFRGVEE